ncbi:sulfate transporter family-domain-containing protein [Halteromyces radiatus]|uniref:sulfate transporter family-domain-containing protein n=1 Tax=Halteromyces radiatus TaxID=101107 RepID=UPI002220447B|nr:sulfate transporter family-domain-containing protein [Halteromyces radiatus]KAI8098500.1 sulfate transporter family-domain-containing protein [Halteromyces radiatus]
MKIVLDYHYPTFQDQLEAFRSTWLQSTISYLINFFPILRWIHRYNLSWLFQDVIAGITVGLLLVPQGIAYAKVANLDPQYGLYTSFVGVTIYCLFGTSKDISIGPITVVSLLVGEAITKVTEAHPDITGPEVAVCLSLVCGVITLLMGMIRLGILVDFISGPAIAGYMSGSAITIGLGQWPKVFGITGVDTRQPPYIVFIQFFKQFATTHIDAAFGITSLIILYVIKFGTGRLAARLPRLKKPLFFMGIMRNGLIVIAGTLLSFLINLGRSSSPFKIIKEVPAGFDAMGVPHIRLEIITESMSVLPSIILILVLEHVSVAKSFGRLSDYEIQPNQEILAIGASNIIGAFFGAYPATGAFSRTAVMARSGAKTPLAGLFTGCIVVLALYVLTPAFYFIPEAVLAAVVIHSVIDLVSGPAYVLELYRTSYLELVVFLLGVGITCFVDVETGIYASVGLSLVIMLLRLARPPVQALGRCPLRSQHYPTMQTDTFANDQHYIYVDETDPHFANVLEPLPPGILVIRLTDSILYPNAGYVAEKLTHFGKTRTRNGNRNMDIKSLPWNESTDTSQNHHRQPLLGAIVLDMTAVRSMDTTGLQALGCVRTTLERHAGQTVEWHFAGLQDARIRQDLLTFGFASFTELDINRFSIRNSLFDPMEMDIDPYYASINMSTDPHDQLPEERYPCFHWDVDMAVRTISERWHSKKSIQPYFSSSDSLA